MSDTPLGIGPVLSEYGFSEPRPSDSVRQAESCRGEDTASMPHGLETGQTASMANGAAPHMDAGRAAMADPSADLLNGDSFHSLSEVADAVGVPQHVLRFWETRFTEIKPLKRGGGRRYYGPRDLTLIKGICTLLHGHAYTIRDVQAALRDYGVDAVLAVGRTGSVDALAEFAAQAEAAQAGTAFVGEPVLEELHLEDVGTEDAAETVPVQNDMAFEAETEDEAAGGLEEAPAEALEDEAFEDEALAPEEVPAALLETGGEDTVLEAVEEHGDLPQAEEGFDMGQAVAPDQPEAVVDAEIDAELDAAPQDSLEDIQDQPGAELEPAADAAVLSEDEAIVDEVALVDSAPSEEAPSDDVRDEAADRQEADAPQGAEDAPAERHGENVVTAHPATKAPARAQGFADLPVSLVAVDRPFADGPELTGSQREKLADVLDMLTDMKAEIAEQLFLRERADGRGRRNDTVLIDPLPKADRDHDTAESFEEPEQRTSSVVVLPNVNRRLPD